MGFVFHLKKKTNDPTICVHGMYRFTQDIILEISNIGISNPDLMWFWDHQPFRVKGSTHQLTISQMPCLGFHSAEVNGTTTTGRTTLPRLPWDILENILGPTALSMLVEFSPSGNGVRNKYNLTKIPPVSGYFWRNSECTGFI